MTGATLFSGFGGADIGMKAAGVEVLWGLELEDDIASVARGNGLNVRTGDITKADPSDFPVVDALHASPVCKSFSVAKAGREELEIDRNAAEATVRFLQHIEPEIFTLENVWGYRDSESWSIIYKALMRLGYGVGHAKLVAADYGVPQTRERMIVWATKGGYVMPPPAPTHMENPPTERGLFGLEFPKWIGWYEAIEDLIPSLPDSKLADWQMKRLPDELRTLLLAQGGYEDRITTAKPEDPSFTVTANRNQYRMRAMLVSGDTIQGDGVAMREGGTASITVKPNSDRFRAVLVEQNANATSGSPIEKEAASPAGTVRTGVHHAPRAVLINGQETAPAASGNREDRELLKRDADAPAFTIKASQHKGMGDAIVGVRVVQMTPRCLARFQSFPDSYELPKSRALACTGVGNAVPPLLQQRLYEHLLSLRKR